VLLVTWPRWEWVAVERLRVPEALAEVVRTGDYHRVLAAAPLVPDEFADRYAWVGPPERVAAQVAALAGCGLAGVTILPHAAGGDVVPTIRRFIEEVRPRVERA
jgi:alkanesulfonate monooxygenase SsuD/methylene tetrahydromethanopterin reductase-like flavin-dependent oxidoreductase (luciferase family)